MSELRSDLETEFSRLNGNSNATECSYFKCLVEAFESGHDSELYMHSSDWYNEQTAKNEQLAQDMRDSSHQKIDLQARIAAAVASSIDTKISSLEEEIRQLNAKLSDP